MLILKGLVAILSTTIISEDGFYEVRTLTEKEKEGILHGDGTISGISHYIGHPATKGIIESAGALKADTNLFPGLKVGECALAFPIKQGRSSRAVTGSTSPHQDLSADDLDAKLIRRIDLPSILQEAYLEGYTGAM